MEEIIKRLSNIRSDVEVNEIENVPGLIDQILSNKENSLYQKKTSLSNLYRIIGSKAALPHFIPTIENAFSEEIGRDLNILNMSQELLSTIVDNDSNIFIENEPELIEIFKYYASLKSSYASMTLKKITEEYMSNEAIRRNFPEIVSTLMPSKAFYDSSKVSFIGELIRKKENTYPNLSSEEIAEDIGQSISAIASIQPISSDDTTIALFNETLEYLPNDRSSYSDETITNMVASGINYISLLKDQSLSNETLDTFMGKLPKEAIEKNYDAIVEKILDTNKTKDYNFSRLLDDFMKYHEGTTTNISSEDFYQKQLRILNQTANLKFISTEEEVRFKASRILAVPGNATFRHLDELPKILDIDLEENPTLFISFFQELMDKNGQVLEQFSDEEKINIYNNLISIVSNSKLEEKEKVNAYKAIINTISSNSIFSEVLNTLKNELNEDHMFSLGSIFSKRMSSLKDDPEKQSQALLDSLDYVISLQNISGYKKDIVFGDIITSTTPNVLSNNIPSLVNKAVSIPKEQDISLLLFFKSIFKEIITSDEYKDSPEKQINIFKEITELVNKAYPRDSLFEIEMSGIMEGMIRVLPSKTKETCKNDLQYYIAKSDDISNHSKSSMISYIYLSTLEETPEKEKSEKLLSLVGNLLNSRILDSSLKQEAFELLIEKTDARLVASNIDSLGKLVSTMSSSSSAEKGSIIGLLQRKHLQSKFKEEPLDPLPDLISSMDSFLENESLSDVEKHWAIEGTFTKLPFDIAKKHFDEIALHILKSKSLSEFYKASCIGSLFGNIVNNPDKLPHMLNMVLSLPEEDLSNFYKNEAALRIWNEIPETEEKYTHLKEYFETLSNHPSNENKNKTQNLLKLLETDYTDNVENYSKTLIEQIDSITIEGVDKQKVYSELILKTSNDAQNISTITEYVKAMQRAGNNEKYDFSSLEALYSSIALDVIQEDIKDEWLFMPAAKKENILLGIQYALGKNNPELLDNPSTIDFIEAVTKGIIQTDENTRSKIESSYSSLLENIKPQRIDEYKALITSGQSIPEDKLEDFEKQLKYLKIKEGKIPKEFYNYIIREAIRGNINKNDRKSLVMNAVTSLVHGHLEEMGIDGYLVTFAKLEPDTIGVHSNNYIRISEDYFKKISLSDIVNTAFHEARHAYQTKAIEKSVIDKKFYKMIKENIIRKYDRGFYDRNYFNMENEFDARVYAALMTNGYLLSIGLTPKEIAEGASKSLEEELIKDKEQDRSVKKSIGEKERTVDEMVLEAINAAPSKIESTFRQNPLLAIEYEIVTEQTDEGNIQTVRRKNKAQIEASKRQMLSTATSDEEKAKIEELFDYILNGEKAVDPNQVTNGEYLILCGYNVETGVSRLPPDNYSQSARLNSIFTLSQRYIESHTANERAHFHEKWLEIKREAGVQEITDQEMDI